jgi:hypothetical protein
VSEFPLVAFDGVAGYVNGRQAAIQSTSQACIRNGRITPKCLGESKILNKRHSSRFSPLPSPSTGTFYTRTPASKQVEQDNRSIQSLYFGEGLVNPMGDVPPLQRAWWSPRYRKAWYLQRQIEARIKAWKDKNPLELPGIQNLLVYNTNKNWSNLYQTGAVKRAFGNLSSSAGRLMQKAGYRPILQRAYMMMFVAKDQVPAATYAQFREYINQQHDDIMKQSNAAAKKGKILELPEEELRIARDGALAILEAMKTKAQRERYPK